VIMAIHTCVGNDPGLRGAFKNSCVSRADDHCKLCPSCLGVQYAVPVLNTGRLFCTLDFFFEAPRTIPSHVRVKTDAGWRSVLLWVGFGWLLLIPAGLHMVAVIFARDVHGWCCVQVGSAWLLLFLRAFCMVAVTSAWALYGSCDF